MAAASTEQPHRERFRLRKRIAPYVRVVLLGVLPCPDIRARHRMRARARELARCGPWPEENPSSVDVARLAVLRLLWLQRQTRRAVRGRHREAAVLLARSSVETCILGFYCLHEAGAPAQLEAANLKALRDMLRYLEDMDLSRATSLTSACAPSASQGAPRTSSRWPSTSTGPLAAETPSASTGTCTSRRRTSSPTAPEACSVMSARTAG